MALRTAYGEWQDGLGHRTRPAATHQAWIGYVLRGLLELPDAAFAEGQAIPDTLKDRSPALLAFLTDPEVVGKILKHLGLPLSAPVLTPARSSARSLGFAVPEKDGASVRHEADAVGEPGDPELIIRPPPSPRGNGAYAPVGSLGVGPEARGAIEPPISELFDARGRKVYSAVTSDTTFSPDLEPGFWNGFGSGSWRVVPRRETIEGEPSTATPFRIRSR